jgi:DNA helicase II / ATP-dependent DNA helicase PcrA
MDSPHALNPAQHAAVNTLRGPLLVLAGAGTGKTRVVTYRIAQLIRHGTRPSRILAVTFTNKAAAEMQQRAMALLGRASDEKPEISTFHSLCVRVLRRNATRLGYPAQFAIYDRGDQESVARSVLREIKVADSVMRPADVIHAIGGWKMQGIRPEGAAPLARSDKEHLASMAYRRYQQSLRQAGALDFDDLLLCTDELFHRFADVRRAEAERFAHLLVDEYQDTNAIQYRIVKALAAGHRNLCVVGDDDQSIYGWRGAEVAHILRFKRDWPEAQVVRLEDNYRSTEAILTLANRLIEHNKQRHPKVLRAARAGGEQPRIVQCQDETAEACEIVDDIRRQLAGGAQPRDFAILFRTNEQPRVFELELRRAKLPYVLVGGMSFYDRKEVRDILAYLKLLASPSDEVSLRRIINTPARGLGQRAVELLLQEAVARGKPLADVLPAASGLSGLTAAAVEGINRLREALDSSRKQLGKRPLVEVAVNLIDKIGYRDEINRLYREPQDQLTRWQAVEEVINSLSIYAGRAKRPTMGGFLDEILLSDRDNDRDKEQKLARNAIALMTLHSAKGLEFPQVYLVGMEEGLLPHHRSLDMEHTAIDEERRLCYVGITRARDRLTLSLALGRTKWGKLRETKPSRFLFELTGKADRANAKRRAAAGKSGRAPVGAKGAAARRTATSSGSRPAKRPPRPRGK